MRHYGGFSPGKALFKPKVLSENKPSLERGEEMCTGFEESSQTSFCYNKRFTEYINNIQPVDTTFKQAKDFRVWLDNVADKYACGNLAV